MNALQTQLQKAMKDPEAAMAELRGALCEASLADFVKTFWHVLEPGRDLKWGWSLDAICEHLSAITDGGIIRLLMNVPPGTMKSLLTSVFWPAWEWGPRGLSYMRFIGASHEQGLATRDTRKMRMLITDPMFQKLWPITLTTDQNQKTYYENDKTGFRQACAVGSMTGKRGDRVIWDDPHSVESALSDAHRTTAVRVFKETLPHRVVDPENSAIVIVMQRLHEVDVAGYILDSDLHYEHLCLPMEFVPEKRCTTSIGFTDPRTEENELLFPRDVVERDKIVLGTFGVAGQFQQDPVPRSGGFFEWEKLEIVEAVPTIKRAIRYWDKAGTEVETAAWTAGVLIGEGVDGLYYVLDVVRGQWLAPKREKVIRQTAETDGKKVRVWVEQEPGSGGKESAESTIKNLAGFIIKAERPTGDKVVRAEPYAVQVEAGNVRLLKGDWNREFISEHKSFPVGKTKDQVDASGGAFNKLAGGNRYVIGTGIGSAA